jgi:hypothetical protein
MDCFLTLPFLHRLHHRHTGAIKISASVLTLTMKDNIISNNKGTNAVSVQTTSTNFDIDISGNSIIENQW